MKKALFTLILGLFAISQAQAQIALPFFTKADAFLKANVSGGGVYYDKIKASPADLNELVTLISTFPVTTVTTDQKKAFFINAYNILVIKNVVDHLPIAKPTDVAGFFDVITFNVAGSKITLSDIENKKIRPVYNDPRVHFALVCAGKGCPPLLAGAYLPATLETQLEAQTKRALNDNTWVKVDATNSKVEYNQILDWYKADFLAASKNLTDYVNKYRTSKIPTAYTVGFYPYDWSLNKR